MSFHRSARLGLLFLILASMVFAQRDLSTIVGVITDPSQAAVVGAKVVITDKACQGKALFVTVGEGITVRNLTLTRARVPDGNGAGIRGRVRTWWWMASASSTIRMAFCPAPRVAR